MTELKVHDSERDRDIKPIKLFYFLYIAGWGAFSVFFPVYLVERGISLAQVGIIMAIPMIIGIFMSIMWSSFSDAIGRRKPFLIQSSILMALFTFAITLLYSFEGFLILGVFKALFIPMAEGLIVTSLFRLSDYRGRATAYSGFAIWGSVGWAIATALAGVAAWVFGITAVFYLASLLFVVATIVYLRVPEPREIEGFPKTSARSSVRPRIITSYFAPIRELLTNKKMVILLLASLPLFAAINAASRFFPIYLESSGASPILIGLAFTFPAILEIPVFLYAGKLSDKIGARKPLLIFSAAVYSLLFFLVLLTSNPVLLLLIHSLLTPFAWAPLITGSSTLVSEIVPRDKWVTGQNLFTIWLWSIGGIIGSLIGGFTSDAWGLPVMFAIASVFALVSGIFFRGVREK
ncbi:hypothetical protein ES706_01127 [subsurface metagenome]|nr:MFS transporter [Hadesarchaea archaeon]